MHPSGFRGVWSCLRYLIDSGIEDFFFPKKVVHVSTSMPGLEGIVNCPTGLLLPPIDVA